MAPAPLAPAPLVAVAALVYHPPAVPARLVTLALQTDKPLAAYGPLAAAAEAYGFDGVTVYNDLLYQPAWLPLLEIARHTRRVRVGPAAVNPFTCHPLAIAGNLALIDEASEGRAYLGLARGAWLEFLGLEAARPVTALREAFECVRRLLARSPEPYPGRVFRLAGGDSLRWPIRRADVPFLLGAWGRQTIRACLPHVGEVKIGGTANPEAIRAVRRDLGAGRVGIVAGAVTVVDRDGAAARALARRQAALYLPIIARLDATLGIEPERLARIEAAARAYDLDGAAREVSDEVLRRVAFAGTPDEVAAQAEELFAAGAGRVEFGTPHGIRPEDGVRLLGEAVLPALRDRG
jgi:5,10-methylenetetrahydromethanopterin reductase